jgi:hypothetical protein
MFFTPENREDIKKYFQGTYLKFKPDDSGKFDSNTLFYIDHIDSYVVTGKVEDGREFKLFLSEEHPYEVDYVLPHKSFFQYDKHAMLLQRVPARQYHRGLCAENTSLSYLDVDKGAIGAAELSFAALKAFVMKQKFMTLKEAITSKKQSCVLNTRMMFVPKNNQIYVDFEPVARVNPGSTIQIIKPLFKHELMQYLHSNNEQGAFAIN